MKYIFFIISVLMLVILAVNVSANICKLTYEQIDGRVLVRQKIILDKEQEIMLDIPNAVSLSANREYSVEGNIMEIAGKEIEVSYIDKESIEKGKNYYFVAKNRFYVECEANISLILDEGFIVKDIYPKESEILSDGRRIILMWKKAIEKGEDFPVFVVMEKTNDSNFAFVFFLAVFLSVGVFLIYNKIKNKKNRKMPEGKTKKKDIEEYLVESEKAVISRLRKEKNNQLWQKQLQIKTGFSKAKLSRVIRNLESRNLIKKIPFGNTNKIKLKIK